jgi:hypothetical protein
MLVGSMQKNFNDFVLKADIRDVIPAVNIGNGDFWAISREQSDSRSTHTQQNMRFRDHLLPD